MDLLTEKELEQIQQKGGDFMGKPTNEYGTPIGGQQFNPQQRQQFIGPQQEVIWEFWVFKILKPCDTICFRVKTGLQNLLHTVYFFLECYIIICSQRQCNLINERAGTLLCSMRLHGVPLILDELTKLAHFQTYWCITFLYHNLDPSS